MGSRAPARSPRHRHEAAVWVRVGCSKAAPRKARRGRRQEADGFPRTCSLSPYTAARRRCGSGLDSARLRPEKRDAGGGRRRMGSRAPARSPRPPPRGGGVGQGWMQQGCAQDEHREAREAAGGGWVPAHRLALPAHRREAAVWVRVGFSKAAPKRTAKPGGGRRRMGSRAPARSPRTPPRGGGVGCVDEHTHRCVYLFV